MSRHYFAIPTNPGEQFPYFASLAFWLISKLDNASPSCRSFNTEFDDPNAIVSTILDAVRNLGQSIEFSPSKLKSGSGEHCVDVLATLAQACLNRINFEYKLPNFDNDAGVEQDKENDCQGDHDVDDADNDEEENLIEIDGCRFRARVLDFDRDENGSVTDDDDDDDDDDNNNSDNEHDVYCKNKSAKSQNSNLDYGHIDCNTLDSSISTNRHRAVEAPINPADWYLEVERVLPQLRLSTTGTNLKDWRLHLDQMKRLDQEIDSKMDSTKQHLGQLQTELDTAMDKIESREKFMNYQLEHVLNDYRTVQDSLNDITQKHQQARSGIVARSQQLAEIGDQLEQVKTEMDKKGSSMTDGSPVIRIKQAIQQLKREMLVMDVQTGVLEHILLRIHLRVHEDHQKLFMPQKDASLMDDHYNAFLY